MLFVKVTQMYLAYYRGVYLCDAIAYW